MDYDLTGLLANPKVTLRPFQIKCFMKQMLKGLEHLHSIDIIHRDIKCMAKLLLNSSVLGANILINSIGELKIADFGLARTFDQDGNMTAVRRLFISDTIIFYRKCARFGIEHLNL